MKIRSGFVSNSSSSSFVLSFDKELTNDDKYQWLLNILPKEEIPHYINLQPNSKEIINFYNSFDFKGTTEEYFNKKITDAEEQIQTGHLKYVDDAIFDRKYFYERYHSILRNDAGWFTEKEILRIKNKSYRRFKRWLINSLRHEIIEYKRNLEKFKGKYLYDIEFTGAGDGTDVYFIRDDFVEYETNYDDDLYQLFKGINDRKLQDFSKQIVYQGEG